MTKNRYEFTGATRDYFGRTLQEIRATSDLPEFGVAAGESGGWIESAASFPQSSKGWIYPPAIVLEGGNIRGGTIWGGTIWGGNIRGGTIEGGAIRGGNIWGGTIRGGTIWGGNIRGGTIEGGTIRGGTIWGGTIWGGTIWGGTIEGGTIEGGNIWRGTIWGGTIEGGTIEGGNIWGGTIRGGTIGGGDIGGGTIEGGNIWGGDMLTIQPLNLVGLRWPITITDSHMAIGCQHHRLTKWWKFSTAVITKMDSNALDFWQANKAMLQALCQSSGRESGL